MLEGVHTVKCMCIVVLEVNKKRTVHIDLSHSSSMWVSDTKTDSVFSEAWASEGGGLFFFWLVKIF